MQPGPRSSPPCRSQAPPRLRWRPVNAAASARHRSFTDACFKEEEQVAGSSASRQHALGPRTLGSAAATEASGAAGAGAGADTAAAPVGAAAAAAVVAAVPTDDAPATDADADGADDEDAPSAAAAAAPAGSVRGFFWAPSMSPVSSLVCLTAGAPSIPGKARGVQERAPPSGRATFRPDTA